MDGRATLTVDDGELLIASPKRGEGIDAACCAPATASRSSTAGCSSPGASPPTRSTSAAPRRPRLRCATCCRPIRPWSWAAVRGRKAPIVGSIVTADVVLSGEASSEADLTAWCAERLPDYSVPRRVRFLDHIPIKETLKSDV